MLSTGHATAKLAATSAPGHVSAPPPSSGPSPHRPPAMPFSKGDAKLRKRNLIIGCTGGGVLLAAIVTLLVMRPWKTEPVRLNDEPYKLARLAASSDFDKLPFDQRIIYMKMMDHKKDVIEQAFNDGKLTNAEYSKCLEAAHLGKQLDRMKRYFDRPPGRERDAYLDKLLIKKEKKQDALTSAARKEKKANEVPRDDADEDIQISNWPSDSRAQWMQYRQAVRDRKKVLKDQHKAQKAATRPTTQAAKPGAKSGT